MKKISLIILGILLSLIILESGLQISSLTIKTIKTIKSYKINKQLKNKDIITILCLGESTTDNQWPPILQKILDEKSKTKKFNIIDGGKTGCNTNDIINIASYITEQNNEIDIIISMMGINDYDKNVVSIKKTKLKTLKLFYLIKKHFISELFADNIEYPNSLLEKAKNLASLKQFKESIALLENIQDSTINKKQKLIKYELLIQNSMALNNYIMDKNNHLEIKKYLDVINQIEKFYMFDISFRMMIFEQDIEQIRNLFSNTKVIDQNFDPIMRSLNELYKIGAPDVIEQINDIIYASINDNSNNIESKTRKIGYVALNYFVEKEYTTSNKFFDLQTKILLNNIQKQTIKNYFKLYKICKNNNIKLIAMQYPVRNIKTLKQILKNFDEVTFISNERNFKQALKTHKVEDIFVDRFAGDFGHCTKLGNTLIAENVAETILKLYN